MSLRWRLGMAVLATTAIGLTGCPSLNQGQGPTHNPNWSYRSVPTAVPGEQPQHLDRTPGIPAMNAAPLIAAR